MWAVSRKSETRGKITVIKVQSPGATNDFFGASSNTGMNRTIGEKTVEWVRITDLP